MFFFQCSARPKPQTPQTSVDSH